jgi:capsular polysaccharide biosynthesis protein
MQPFYKTLKNPIKWIFLTTIVVALGFVFSSQLVLNESYSDDASKALVNTVEEASEEAEQLKQLDFTSYLLNSYKQLQFSGNLNPHHLFFSEFASRLAFLYRIRPRSPPSILNISI